MAATPTHTGARSNAKLFFFFVKAAAVTVFNTTATASGRKLDDGGITVAVPESQSWRLGQAVAVMCGDKVVVATVTDTGGFAPYGRDLDLAPGTWKALGARSVGDWGVRTVYYKFL